MLHWQLEPGFIFGHFLVKSWLQYLHSFYLPWLNKCKKLHHLPLIDLCTLFLCTLFFLLIIEILPRSLKYCILSCNLQKCGIFLPRNYIMSHCIQLNKKTFDINHGGNFEAKSIFKIHQKNHWWLELSARGKKCFMKTASIIRLLCELKSLWTKGLYRYKK